MTICNFLRDFLPVTDPLIHLPAACAAWEALGAELPKLILKTAQTTQAVGTGGTPFTFYLQKHIKETEAHLL